MTHKQLCGLRMPMTMPMGVAAYSTAMIDNGPKTPKTRLRDFSEVLTGLAHKTLKVVFGWVMNEAADGILLRHSWVLKWNVHQFLCLVFLRSRTLSSGAAPRIIILAIAHRAPYSMANRAKARSHKETLVPSCSSPQHTA